MALDLNKLKELREKTGVSFSMCKKALEESDNDIKKAIALLSEWGVKKAADKADRETGAGGIFTYMHHNKKIGTMIELRSETDFVSGNEEFQKLGMELAMQASFSKKTDVEKFLQETYIRDSSKSVEQMIKDAVLKFGENIKVTRVAVWELGE